MLQCRWNNCWMWIFITSKLYTFLNSHNIFLNKVSSLDKHTSDKSFNKWPITSHMAITAVRIANKYFYSCIRYIEGGLTHNRFLVVSITIQESLSSAWYSKNRAYSKKFWRYENKRGCPEYKEASAESEEHPHIVDIVCTTCSLVLVNRILDNRTPWDPSFEAQSSAH
jgi:hypothetical protein